MKALKALSTELSVNCGEYKGRFWWTKCNLITMLVFMWAWNAWNVSNDMELQSRSYIMQPSQYNSSTQSCLKHSTHGLLRCQGILHYFEVRELSDLVMYTSHVHVAKTVYVLDCHILKTQTLDEYFKVCSCLLFGSFSSNLPTIW